MKIRMNSSLGTLAGSLSVGQEVDSKSEMLTDAEMSALVRSGAANLVEGKLTTKPKPKDVDDEPKRANGGKMPTPAPDEKDKKASK